MTTTNTQHTPGPWKVTKAHSGSMAIGASTLDDQGLICVLAQWRKEHEANARLIASAPELKAENERLKKRIQDLEFMNEKQYSLNLDYLKSVNAELLEALRFIVNCQPVAGEDAVLNYEGYNKACAAIAKAEGK